MHGGELEIPQCAGALHTRFWNPTHCGAAIDGLHKYVDSGPALYRNRAVSPGKDIGEPLYLFYSSRSRSNRILLLKSFSYLISRLRYILLECSLSNLLANLPKFLSPH
jgi:hypothetical protein